MPCAYRKGESKRKYAIVDEACLGRSCFTPGEFQHRGAVGASGSKNSGMSLKCMTNAYHGCPYENGEKLKPSVELSRQRKVEGWKFIRYP